MKLVSVNVGLPREVEWNGKIIRTSIWKTPVECRVRVNALNVEGDQQSDLSLHGGRDKAVYVYASEHYPYTLNIAAAVFRAFESERFQTQESYALRLGFAPFNLGRRNWCRTFIAHKSSFVD